MVIEIIKMIFGKHDFANFDNLLGVKFATVMVQDTPNLSTDFVQDMLVNSIILIEPMYNNTLYS